MHPFRAAAPPIVLLVFLAGIGAVVRGHDLARSESTVSVAGPRALRVALTLNLLDFAGLADLDRNRDQVFSYDEVDRGIDRLYDTVRAHFEIGGPQPPAAVSLDRYAMVDATAIRLDLTYRFDADVSAVRVRSTLAAVTQPEHVHLTALEGSGDRRQAALAGDAREAIFALPGAISFDRLLQIAIVIVALVSLAGYVLVRRFLLS